ncbi:MAG: trypsin-like peptidase domain-containing protein [Crocinitomicaceae bacterium]
MEAIINDYKDVIVQIHTPGGSGTGFIVRDQNLIVTNRHVIQGNQEVIIRGENFKKTLTDVIYSDALNDIAFLKIPESLQTDRQITISNELVNAGQQIIAIGHPLGLRFTATQGIISKSERKFNNVDYIQVDAAINPGNSGGPLINERGEVVGVNTFIYRDGESLGFALPSTTLNEILREYGENMNGQRASKCPSCTNLVTQETLTDGYCPSCGNKFDLSEFDTKEYTPEGVSKTMEDILAAVGVDVKLSRVGKSAWDIEEGSALIKITHNLKNRFIYCDAVLGSLPKQNIGDLYAYMLKENYDLECLSFSVNKQNIMLSTIIYDADLNSESGKEILGELIKKADEYDNFMADTYGMELAEHI